MNYKWKELVDNKPTKELITGLSIQTHGILMTVLQNITAGIGSYKVKRSRTEMIYINNKRTTWFAKVPPISLIPLVTLAHVLPGLDIILTAGSLMTVVVTLALVLTSLTTCCS